MTQLDPDPLDLRGHPAYVLGYSDGWEDAPRHPGGKVATVVCADPSCRFVAYHVVRAGPSRRRWIALVVLALAVILLLGIALSRGLVQVTILG